MKAFYMNLVVQYMSYFTYFYDLVNVESSFIYGRFR